MVEVRGGSRAAAAALACLVGACSVDPRASAPADSGRASRAAREAQMNQAWKDRTLAELLAALGRPRLLLDIPGGGQPPGFVVVYPRDAATGCMDTFALLRGPENRVRSYQCR